MNDKKKPYNRVPIGTLKVWKDRPGRTRIMIKTKEDWEEARRFYYKQYHPHEEIKGFRILQLDMNVYNFNEDNLVKVTPQEMNCLLNNKLLSNDIELNKLAIITIRNDLLTKKIKKKEG